MNKIKRLSAVFKFIFYALLMVFPLLVIAYWAAPLVLSEYGIRLGIPAGTKILHTLTWQEKGVGFLISLLPNLLTMAIFYCLAKLFALYEQGRIFVLASSRYLKKTGILLLINVLITPLLVDPFVQAFITIHNPSGSRYASITLGQYNLFSVFMALLIILISWIMTEACKIHDEQQLTV